MLIQSAISALVNLVLFVGIPLVCYIAWHKRRHGRRLPEIAERAGLQRGDWRSVGYCTALAALIVIALVIWPPPLEVFTRKGSPQQRFVGLGPGGTSVTMALLYGLVQTGFPEELLFRGLIAGSLGRRLPLAWANLWQALIFLLPHLIVLVVMPEAWWVLVVVFAGALFAGWARIRSGSILGPTILHAAANVTMCMSVAIRSAP